MKTFSLKYYGIIDGLENKFKRRIFMNKAKKLLLVEDKDKERNLYTNYLSLIKMKEKLI